MYEYEIIIGETGNEVGHTSKQRHDDDRRAVLAAKRAARAYKGDGWWIVRDDCGIVARGGKA